MNQQTENTAVIVEETANVGDKPATQTVGVVGGATSQEEQSSAEREAAIRSSKEEAKRAIDEVGDAGFILVAMQGNGTARAMLSGDFATVVFATVVRAAYTAVCAVGGIVKHIHGEHDGNPDKHAKVEDFTAGVGVLTMHHGMLADMHADQVDEAQIEAAASVKQ